MKRVQVTLLVECHDRSGPPAGKFLSRLELTPNRPTRKVPRHAHEAARDAARRIVTTDAYADASRRRKKLKMLFAHIKQILRLDRLRLRRPSGARDELFLAATTQNLQKLAKLIPWSPKLARTPKPGGSDRNINASD